MQMNNNSPLNGHCFSCGKELSTISQNRKLQKHEYPVCNQKSDVISLEKHFLCRRCMSAFDSVKMFVNKYKLKSFSKDFKLDKVIDSSFIKMAHFETLFTKQNKRQSEIFESKSAQKTQQQGSETTPPKEGLQFNLNLPNDIYSAIINDSIESQNLHHVYWLPKTLQYLIYLTAKQKMRPQQRRQRVKKTLQAVSYIYCVEESELKYLAIVIQTLFCYMQEETLLKILDRLLKGFLQNNVSLEFFLIEDDDNLSSNKVFEQRHLHQKSIEFRPDCILYTIFSVMILLDFFKEGKLQRHFSQLVHLAHQQLWEGGQEEQVQEIKRLERKYQSYLKRSISDHSKLSKLSEGSWEQLVEGKKQKNQLNLIIKTMKKQQQENLQIMKEMEGKYKKQKDEYINKIVRLNNRIEQLEYELKSIKETLSPHSNSNKNSRIIRLKQDYQEVKSNPQTKIIDLKDPKNQPITERTQIPFSQALAAQQQGDIKKHKSQLQTHKQNDQSQTDEALSYLKSILQITDLINFNNKACKKAKKESASFPIPQIPNTIKEISQVIITEISNLEKKTSSLVQQNKKLKEQSTRLLSILKRKEESWLPLLHQKDEIISLYEKALICMEKGYILAEEPLSSRIQTIIETVSKVQFRKLKLDNDNTSLRDTTSVRSSVIEDFPQDLEVPMKNYIGEIQPPAKILKNQSKTPVKQKKLKQNERTVKTSSNQKSSSDNKIKKKTKKQKQKQKQCLIY